MRRPLVVDGHSDLMIDVADRAARGERDVIRRRHLPALRAGGIDAAVVMVGGDVDLLCPDGLDRPYESVQRMIDILEADIAGAESEVGIATAPDDVRRLTDGGRTALLLGVEGASCVGDDLARMEDLHARGLRWLGLTWNSRNALATGLGHPDAGLTELGALAVREAARLGMLVDVSHATERTFWDVVAACEGPFVASHSNARAIFDHPRNLSDEQLDAVAAAGGVVGVVFYPGFVGSQPVRLEHVVQHVLHLVERMGVDHVAVGADFMDYYVDRAAEGLAEGGLSYSPEDFVFPPGLEDCSGFRNFLEALHEEGFSRRDVEKIAGGNVLRVFAEVSDGAALEASRAS
jgi:membrane dipeptidase